MWNAVRTYGISVMGRPMDIRLV